jgi:hypothetical protein
MNHRIFLARLSLTIGFCAIAFGAAISVRAQGPSVPEAHIVLFTPSDIQPPPAEIYQLRLRQFGLYAEKFFHKELKRWGHEPKRREIFDRDTTGRISTIHVKGDLPAAGGEYRRQWISRQVLGKLKSEFGMQPAGNLFWIFVYVGDPPAKHANYRGSGNSKDGGWAVLNYTNLPGRVWLDRDMVSEFHDKLFLKGCVHEFGHALGLPHIGPKVELRRGNTLMGPITRIYVGQKMPHQTKAYLSEASAAILSAHPIFTGDASDRNTLPETAFQQIRVDYDRNTRTMSVRGKLEANYPLHRLVVIDDRDDKIGGYWVKGFVAELDNRSQFSLSIPQPGRSGKLKILAVYKNGAFTGNGKKRGIDSANLVPYSFR